MVRRSWDKKGWEGGEARVEGEGRRFASHFAFNALGVGVKC